MLFPKTIAFLAVIRILAGGLVYLAKNPPTPHVPPSPPIIPTNFIFTP